MQKPSEKQFVASIVGVPNVVAEGQTKTEAIENAKIMLEKQLADGGEFVTIDIVNPIAQGSDRMRHAGILADDPTFDDWMSKLAEIRQAANNVED